MKVILSRKGFDSQYGGYPSPILPDGRMISLYIPDSNSDRLFSDLKFNEDKTYLDLINELNIKNISYDTKCHLDPDLCKDIVKRPSNWRAIFGQAGSAQGHLNKQNIKEGDLFLFFGTFQKTIIENNKLKFDSNDKPKHIIFGYLQVGKIVKSKEEREIWMKEHPHYEREEWNNKNAMYIARENLSWNKTLPGAGVLMYNNKLILTKEGQNKSLWDIPILKGKKISYHNENSWINGLLKSASKGQEFVIEESPEIEEWAKGLIEN